MTGEETEMKLKVCEECNRCDYPDQETILEASHRKEMAKELLELMGAKGF